MSILKPTKITPQVTNRGIPWEHLFFSSGSREKMHEHAQGAKHMQNRQAASRDLGYMVSTRKTLKTTSMLDLLATKKQQNQ